MPAIEHDLFIEWMKWLQKNSPLHKFTYDGIVSMEDWLLTPTKILLVLKDYNDTCHAEDHLSLDQFDIDDREAIKSNIPNLRYHLAHSIADKRNWRTWNNAARWIYGLLNSTLGNYPPYSEASSKGDSRHRTVFMKKVAVLDLKKQPGKSACSRKMLDDYFAKHHESYSFLARQISLYGHLDYIVCCGDGILAHFLHVLGIHIHKSSENKIVYKGEKFFLTVGGTLIIDYRHPLLLQKGVSAKEAYISLMKIVQTALKIKSHV